MNTRTLVAVTLGAVVLSACAGKSFVVNEKYYPNGLIVILADRKVNVTIDGDVIIVNREPLKLNGNPGEPATVYFRLQTQGYVFKPLQMSPDPLQWGALKGSPKFGDTTCVFGADETELNCTFTPTQRKQINTYVLRVCDATGASCFASDPSMMN